MNYVTLPHTDLRVSTICLGTGDMGAKIDRKTSFQMLDRFVVQGGAFLDTANVYSDWIPGTKSTSEKTIGAWLRRSGRRDRVILGTKGGHPNLDTMHISRLSRREIVHDLEQSLGHLQTDVIDLYWLHRDDPRRPVGEILDVLNDQVKTGKIRYFGCSNWSVARIRAAQDYARQHGLHGFVADQMLWNLAVIDANAIQDKTIVLMDDELKRFHLESGMAAVPFSSQANGLFQKMAQGTDHQMRPAQQAMYGLPENRARGQRALELAAALSTNVTGIVLGYLQAQPFVTVPIVGCRSPEQLDDSLAAGDMRLTTEQAAYLENGSAATGRASSS